MDEQQFVVQVFQKAFFPMKDISIVLYGLGKNTEAVLLKTEGFHFAGLMDNQNVGKRLWGYDILSEQQVLRIKPLIVVLARESIVPIIYERIAHLHKNYGLEIYDFKGELLGQKQWEYSNGDIPYWNVTEGTLRKAIDEHDCISYDIFDTLLMRRVLEPTDVFAVVERTLSSKSYADNCFKERRIQAEQSLDGYPTIHQIYEQMGKLYMIPQNILDIWKQVEIEVEKKVLIPRKKMLEFFHYSMRNKKRVFLISDMYYSKTELVEFLQIHGITGYSDILVSCDYKKGKVDGSLYEVYKQMTGAARCLHIGDNRKSDGIKAEEHGLDAFLIYSAYEMWMASSMQTTLSHVSSLEQRCILANLVWKYCENPFALQKSSGIVTIDVEESLGYLYLGPLYTEFLQWLMEMIEKEKIEQLLLPARDGYLIKQMLERESRLDCEAVYFKASRRAVSIAAIYSKDDILQIVKRVFHGTYGQLLQHRFGVHPKEEDRKKDQLIMIDVQDDVKDYIMGYEDAILLQAEEERKGYLSYLKQKGLLNGKKQALFDFVAGGTVQHYLSKLIGHDMQGFYFASMNLPNDWYEKGKEILEAYGNIQSYGTENQVGKYYLVLETIMVDGYPTFVRVTGNGEFLYEALEENNFEEIQKVQNGILIYQQDIQHMKSLVPMWKKELGFADEIFGLLFTNRCVVSRKLKNIFINDDSFDGVEAYKVWNSEGK